MYSTASAGFDMVGGAEGESLGVSGFQRGILLDLGPGEDDGPFGDCRACHDRAGKQVGAWDEGMERSY